MRISSCEFLSARQIDSAWIYHFQSQLSEVQILCRRPVSSCFIMFHHIRCDADVHQDGDLETSAKPANWMALDGPWNILKHVEIRKMKPLGCPVCGRYAPLTDPLWISPIMGSPGRSGPKRDAEADARAYLDTHRLHEALRRFLRRFLRMWI